jgi:hypothetical protein
VRRRIPAAEIDGALADVARIAASNGSLRAADSAVQALEARSAEGATRVRREIRAATKPAPPAPYRRTPTGPAPYRPRDLDFALVTAVLAAAEEQP